jgi:hypothetical protein
VQQGTQVVGGCQVIKLSSFQVVRSYQIEWLPRFSAKVGCVVELAAT